MFFLVFVLFRVWRGIAALPEGFNKVVALFVVGKLLKGGPLLVADNVSHILVQPLFVGLAEFDVERPFLLFLLFVRGIAFERIGLICGLRLRARGCRVRRGCIGGWGIGGGGAGGSRLVALRAGKTRGASQKNQRCKIT